MKNQIKKLLSLTLALTMLLSLAVVPQATATASAADDEVLVWADFEEGKGGFQAQFQSVLGGVDRVYTDAAHGKSYRIFSRTASDTATTVNKQLAWVSLGELVNSGKLHISYEVMTDTPTLGSILHVNSTNTNEWSVPSSNSPKLWGFGRATNKGLAASLNNDFMWRPGDSSPRGLDIESDTWYQLDAIVDFDYAVEGETTGKIDFYLNGELLVTRTGIINGEDDKTLLTSMGALMFEVSSVLNTTDCVNLYIDNFKVAKLGTASELTIDSTVVAKDKKAITFNLSETIVNAPALSSADVSVLKRGNDESEAITSVSAIGRKVTIELASALESGMEYEVKVNAAFTGLNGLTTADICKYVYIEKAKTEILAQTFDTLTTDTVGTLEPTSNASNKPTSTMTRTVEAYPGRSNVLVGRTPDTGAVGTKDDFYLVMGLSESQYINTDGKYEITYSNMVKGVINSSGTTSGQYPVSYLYGTNGGFNQPWGSLTYWGTNKGRTSNILAAAGGYDANAGSHVVTLPYVDRSTWTDTYTKRYNFTSDQNPSDGGKETSVLKKIRHNSGEWYEIKVIVDVANNTVDSYCDGVYLGRLDSTFGIEFKNNTNVAVPLTSLVFYGTAYPGAVDATQRGEYMLDDIKIVKLDESAYVKSIRFADKDGNEAFSTGTVGTLNNYINITAENTDDISDFGTVTLTEDGTEKAVSASYADGVYTIDLGGYLKGNTDYVLSVLGETYEFTTDAGGFKIEKIDICDASGNEISNLSGVTADSKVRVKVTVANTTGGSQTAWISGAYYNGNVMGDVIFKTITSDGSKTFFDDYVELTVTDTTNLKVSGFAWDGISTMKPLIKNAVLPN